MFRRNGSGLVFDGESQDVEEFLNSFVYETLMFGWNKESQVVAIKCCLVGKALQIYNGLSNAEKADIDEIMHALRQGCVKSPDYYLNLFYTRKLKPEESIASFCHDIERLLNKGMPGLETESKSKLLRARLIANVPENVKNYMEMLSDKSWRDLVALFDKSVDYISIAKTDDDIILANKLSAMNSPLKFTGECFYCRKVGHRKSDCRKRQADERQQKDLSRRQNFDRNRTVNQNQYQNRNFSNNNNYNEKKNFINRNDYRKSGQAFVIDAELEDEDNLLNLNSLEYFVECNGLKANNLERVSLLLKIGNWNTKINMLVDCGSSGSFINPTKLPREIQDFISNIIQEEKMAIKNGFVKTALTIKSALSTKRLDCIMGDIKFSTNDWSGQHSFIFTDISEAGILGIDFLRRFNANIDYANNRITIKPDGKEIQLNYVESLNKNQENQDKILTLEPKTIKPKSEMVIRCKTNFCLRDKEFFVEPKNVFSKSGLVIGKSMNKLNDKGEVYILVVNTSDKPFYFDSDVEIGTAHEVEVMNTEIKKENESKLKIDVKKLHINNELPVEERNEILKLIMKHQNAFKWTEDDIGLTNLAEHEIDTGSAKPIKQRQYRLPQSAQEEVGRQVEDMLNKNIISESKSPWCSPILLVKKKPDDDGKCEFRFCIDFRKLNEATIKDSYPLPRIDETADALGGSRYFSTLDLASGFWQIPLSESSKQKTAFCANNKLFEFNVMPFGLCNAPPTFQRLMDNLLRNLTWKHCLVYLDDVIVFSQDLKTHIERLGEVLRRFEAANLKLKPSK